MSNEQQREFYFPATGIGPEGAFEVTCLGRKFTIGYVCNMREGSDVAMAEETIKHFKHAVQCAAAGHSEISDKVKDRSEFQPMSSHGDAMTTVWTFRSFAVVPGDGVIYKVPINICNEITHAQALLNAIGKGAELMSGELHDDFMRVGSIINLSQQQSPKPQAKPKSQLDEYFPRDENNQPVQPGQQPPPQQQLGGSVYIGAYDYKRKMEYAGQTIKVDIRKMTRVFDTRDGSPQVQVFSSYNGGVSKYPSHDLRVKENRREKLDDWARGIIDAVLDGAEDTNHYIGTYYMFVPEDSKDKCYPLLTKLEVANGATEPQAISEPGEPHPGDEIPW